MLAVLLYSFIGPYLLHWQPYVVLSGSMEPAIPVGAVAIVDTKAKNPEVGDIVTYELLAEDTIGTGDGNVKMAKTGTLVTHRVSRHENGYYVMKGDANENEDFNVVYPEQIIGTYKMHVPELGFLLKKMDMKLRLMLAGLLVMLNVTSTCLSIAVQTDNEDNKKKKEKTKKKNKSDGEDKRDEDAVSENEENSSEKAVEWKCPKCGVMNTGKFCSECGAVKPGEWKCPECGTINSTKFCTECGVKKPEEANEDAKTTNPDAEE